MKETKTLSKDEILNLTHYGLKIYAHVLRQYYPDSIVLNLNGRDCGMVSNPFYDGDKTLHIWIQKCPMEEGGGEQAIHKDEAGIIPDGDAFSFAALHYKMEGEDLLRKLCDEMHLGVKVEIPQRGKDEIVHDSHDTGLFSFFRAPSSNLSPYRNITIGDVYKYITGDYAKKRTEHLRSLSDKKEAKAYKRVSFDYVTFAGVFSKRTDSELVQLSGYTCMDFDDLPDVEAMFETLLVDQYLDTVLLFRSPSGNGLKWVIDTDAGKSYDLYYKAVSEYLRFEYGVKVDGQCRNVSRACFLPYDPKAYMNNYDKYEERKF